MLRRNFIKNAALISAGLSVADPLYSFTASRKKNILILGGTNFIGPAIVKAALANHHNVTLFNRGITNPELFPGVKRIKGDRTKGNEGLSALANTKWDVVIDTWPENPETINYAAQFLQGLTNHYIFISTIAAYADYKIANITEEYPTKKGEGYVEGHYGTNKSLCEKNVLKAFAQNHTIIRPGSIIGDRDPSYAFRFWTWRIKNGGEIIAPGNGKDIIQFIDVNDVADFVIRCVEKEYFGIFNTVGPEKETTFSKFIQECKHTLNSTAAVTWINEDFITKNNINSRSALPLWNSLNNDYPGFENISNAKARLHGMKFKPVKKMILESMNEYSPGFQFGNRSIYAGISAIEEAQLLNQWKQLNNLP